MSVAKPTKQQTAFVIGRNVINQISVLANAVRDLLKDGTVIDQGTGEKVKIECSPDEVRSSWSHEQAAAIDEFVKTWSSE